MKKKTYSGRGIGKWCARLNVLLLCLLAVECFVAAAIYTGARLPVPDAWVGRLRNALGDRGITLDFSTVWLGFDFSIHIDDASLRLHGTPSPFLSAGSVCVGVDPLFALNDSLPVRFVRVDSAEVYSPLSSADENARIAGNLSLRASPSSLDYMVFDFMGIEVECSGKFDKDATYSDIINIFQILGKWSGGGAAKPPSDETTPERIAAIAEEISSPDNKVAAHLNAFENKKLKIEFGFLKTGSFINAEAYCDRFNSSKMGSFGVSAEGIKITLNYVNTDRKDRIGVFAGARKLSCPNFNVCATNVLLNSGVEVSSKAIELYDVDLSAADIEVDGTRFDNVMLSKDRLSRESYADGWRFLVSSGANRFGGVARLPSGGKTSIDFGGNVSIDNLLSRKEFSSIPEIKDFSFPHGVNIKGRLEYEFGHTFPEMTARIDASDCEVMRLQIDSMSADVVLEGGILKCTDIRAKSKEGWSAEGTYEQNFINNAYDICVRGNLRPMAIAHFMEPWWARIMGSFAFEKNAQMPYADIRVEGTWGAPENIWCFGYVEGQNAVYSGSKFDAFSTYIWVNPTRISLYDVKMRAQNRRGRCFIEWLYDGGKGLTSYDRQRLKLKSNLNDRELISLGGADAKEVLDVVAFENPPDLELNALMFNPDNNPKSLKDIFNAKISAKGRMSVEMINLDDPVFEAFSDKTDTDIKNAFFKFCGGEGNGILHLKKAKNTVLVDGRAHAEKMNQGLFFDFLSSLGGDADGDDDSESMLGGDADGEVSADIHLKGDVKNMAESIGHGVVSIDSKDFMRLNLFGRISKAFSSIGLPVGTFDITRVNSEFSISDGKLRLSPLEMEGPAMRIIGAASYTFKDDSVRGELKAYPFENVSNRIVSVVNKIVNPIMDTVRVTVSGTLADPEFWAKITPADVIRNEKKVIEGMDKSL